MSAMSRAAGGSRLLSLALFGLLTASGCRSSTSTSEPAGKVESAPENAPVTLNLGPSTLDSFGADSGASCSDAGPPLTGLDGGSSCGATLAASTFQYAICSCGSLQSTGVLTTDGYDSTKGGPTGALGANVGFNASAAWSSAPSLGGNLFSPGGISAPKGGLIRGDLHLGGAVAGGGQTFTVDGNAFVEATLPSSVKVLGAVTHVSSIASPCNCGSPLPISSLVSAHAAPNNEDSAIGLSASAAGGGNPSQIDLPCGDFYLTVISPSKPLTIAAHGHTELYISGAVSASSALTFSIDPGASLDLFVAGGFSATSTLNLGTVSSPSSCRVYVAGSQFAVPSSASIACNIYAPSASIALPSTTAYGAIFSNGVTASGSATLHYDTSIENGTCATCTAASCNDGNPCTVDTCSSNGTCTHTNASNGTSCPTGANVCDQSYTCQAGACVGSNPVTCTAQDPCHGVGTCNQSTGVCSNPSLANGTSCNDGNACDLNDSCQSGVCTAGSHVACTAPDSCHSAGACNASTGVCSAPTLNAGFCFIGGACVASGATNGANTCATCQPTASTAQYSNVSNGTSCNDGSACDLNDSCQSGVCTAGSHVTCSPSDQCHAAGACNPSTGACSNPSAPDGTSCTGTNLCNLTYACAGGTCTGSTPVTCVASGQCQVAGTCNPTTGACSSSTAPDGTACNDGNPCTQGDSCSAGTCAGTAVTCTASDSCHTAGTCDPVSGACSNPPVADGTACTGSDLCQKYSCTGGTCGGSTVTCQALDACHTAGTCDPTTGQCTNPAIPGCDSSPTIGDNPFEKQASIIGRVQTFAGGPVTGYTITIYDMPVGAEPRTDVSVTVGGDGSFWARLTTFPDSEPPKTPPHHLMLFIDAPGFLRAKRDFRAHPGTAFDLGVIDLAPRDPNTVVIDSTGGSITDSQGLITIQFPPGSLSGPTPITVTPIAHRDEMPAALPPISATGYGFEIEPSGTQLAVPATVKVSNWRNLPTTLSMPTGTFDETNGGWKHVDMSTWNGAAWTVQIQHFSSYDINPNEYGEWVLFGSNGHDPNGGKAVCGGSALSLSGGATQLDVTLPTYPHRGRAYGVTLNYNSGLAASRTLGTPPATTSQAVPVTGVGVSLRGTSFQRQCVAANSRAAALIAATPGACGGGGCSLAVSSGWTLDSSMLGMHSTVSASPTSSATAIDYGNWIDLPLMPDGTVPSSGFLGQQIQAGPTQSTGSGGSSASSACLTAGAFTSPNVGAAVQTAAIESGPLLQIERQVFMHHRHSSPVGPGWAISEVTRLYPEPQADHAILVGGDGSEEDFRLRPTIRTPFAANGSLSYAFALDPMTGEEMMAVNGTIVRLNADGSTTSIATGIAYSGSPQSLAITYVGGERRFLLATGAELVQIHPSGAVDVLFTRSAPGSYVASQVAGRNDLALYTAGNNGNPVLYRIRLSTPPGAPEVISFPQATGGDIGLDPRDGVVGSYRFYGPAGVAYSAAGALYVADAPRNAVFMVEPDLNGEISAASAIFRIAGDGAGRYVPEPGTPFAGTDLPINQPFLLSVSPDGTLLMASSYGVAAYDPQSTEAEWIAFGESAPGSELSVDLTGSGGNSSNIAATGPRTFLVAITQSDTWPSIVDASQLTSERDPTRTLSLTATGAQIVDATQGLVDSFDGQGRMMQHDLRTGEPIFAVTYADAQSDRVQAITNPEGTATTFAYDSSHRLQTITDPAHRQTVLSHDGSGDLRSVMEPDGEVIAFAYQGHLLTSKTDRGTDVTQYAYNSDGTLHSATKPAGETTTISVAALDQPPQYDANGNPSYSGSYTDAHGVVHAFVIDPMGQLQSDTYVADGVTYSLNARYYGNLEPVAGDVFSYKNKLLRIDNELLNGITTRPTSSFDSLGRLVAIGNSGGLSGDQTIAYYSYDSNGFLSDVSLGGLSYIDQAITRDAAGHVLQVLEHGNGGHPNRHEVDYTWRPDGQPSTVTRDGLLYALSYDETTTHELTGNTDALGRTLTLGLDAVGRVAMSTIGNPAANGGDGSTTSSFVYDNNNRLVVAADALGNQTTLGYTQVSCGCTEADEVSTIHTPDLPAGQQWQLAYGLEGRLSSVTDPDGFPEAYGYEPTGELSSVIDRDGNPTTITHDHLGRIASVVDALNRAHARSYAVPSGGAWVGPTLASGSASLAPASTNFSAQLNAGDYQIGNALYQGYGLPPAESFYRDATFDLPYVEAFDLGGRLASYTERPGQASSSVEPYDGSGVTEDITYDTYDSRIGSFFQARAGSVSSFGYNNEYDLVGSTGYGQGGCTGDPTVSEGFTRDLASRVTDIHVAFNFGSNCGSPPTVPADETYAYYASGQVQKYTGPDGTKVYTYDGRGLVQNIAITLGDGGTEAWGFTYDSAGRSLNVTYPDGHVRVQVYDAEGRLSSRCYTYGSQSFCYTATYDGVGNPKTTSDPYGGSETYTYDTLNRLTSVTRSVSGAVEHTESYSYNALGALHTSFDPVAMSAFTYDDQRAKLTGGGTADSAIPNTLGGIPVTRDTLGQISGLNGVSFTFDNEHRVFSTQTTSGANTISEAHRYDASLRRVYRAHAETSPTTSTQEFYVYDRPGPDILGEVDPSGLSTQPSAPGNIVAIVNSGGAVQDAYFFGGIDQPLRLRRGGNSYFYDVDLTGNVRRLRDATGADLGGYRYTAFGNAFASDAGTPAAAIDQPLRWKARPFLNLAGGLYDMRARFWSPGMGAFLTIDGYAYHDSNSMLWGWPGQNPMAWRDPNGHEGEDILTFFGPAVDAVLGAAALTAAGVTSLVAANGYIYGVLLPQQVNGLISDLSTPTVFAQEQAPSVPDTPATDETGKVHGDIPNVVPDAWTGDDVAHAIDELIKSIEKRNEEQRRLGEDGPHRERIRREEDFLRKLRKRRNDLGTQGIGLQPECP